MLFNSHIFMLLFLPLLLAGWYFLNWKKKFQLAQGYLIGMSLWFYAYANLQYLWLLLFSCLIGWLLSCLPEKIFSEKGKKVLTGVGCVFHLGLLGYFKYSNFFLENLNTVFHTDFPMLQILLPVGISFYTFQQLAYLIDRCRGDAPRDSFFDYLTFMVYFPQLLQGPILLRSEFMGQLKEPERRRFHAERFSEGIQFFVFGLAKKVLQIEMGADVRYFSKYYAPDYSPVIGQFYNQNPDDKIEIGAFPIVNVYANLHLKRTRFFIMMYHVNAGSGKSNYFLAPHYPINPRMIKFGLSWNFFD